MANNNFIFRSGRYKNYPLEHVFYLDPIHISRFYQKMINRVTRSSTPNAAQLAVNDLMEKLKQIKATKTCPICKEELVYYFLIPDAGAMSEKLICCNQADCKNLLRASRKGELYKIHKFLPLLSHLKRADANKIVNIYKKTHENYEEILEAAFA